MISLDKPIRGMPTHQPDDFAKVHRAEVASQRRKFEYYLENAQRFLWRIKGANNQLGDQLREKICRLEETIGGIDGYAACVGEEFFATIVEQGREVCDD
jgi:hypothetical protein